MMSLCIRTFIHFTARLEEDLLNWPKTEGKYGIPSYLFRLPTTWRLVIASTFPQRR